MAIKQSIIVVDTEFDNSTALFTEESNDSILITVDDSCDQIKLHLLKEDAAVLGKWLQEVSE